MNADDFGKMWNELHKERGELLEQRTNLETELVEVRSKLSHVNEALDQLAPLAGLMYADENDFQKLGITDAIRCVVKRSEERLSAQDVRRLLIERGYDLSDLSAPMASIYTILRRLEESDEVERETEGGKVFYQWNYPKPSLITDDDIPF